MIGLKYPHCSFCRRYLGTTAPAWVVYGSDHDREYCSPECLRAADPHAAQSFDQLVRAGDAFFRPPARRRLDEVVIL